MAEEFFEVEIDDTQLQPDSDEEAAPDFPQEQEEHAETSTCWRTTFPHTAVPSFKGAESGPSHVPTSSKNPVEWFEMIISSSAIEEMAAQTMALSATERGKRSRAKGMQKVTANEIKQFLGILIFHGLRPAPQLALYWSSNPLFRCEGVVPLRVSHGSLFSFKNGIVCTPFPCELKCQILR
jgi:hypothetical protein